MKTTKIYISILYFVTFVCSLLFVIKEQYNIATLLILGNAIPGYPLAKSLLEKNGN